MVEMVRLAQERGQRSSAGARAGKGGGEGGGEGRIWRHPKEAGEGEWEGGGGEVERLVAGEGGWDDCVSFLFLCRV